MTNHTCEPQLSSKSYSTWPFVSVRPEVTAFSGPMAEALEMWTAIENHVPAVLFPDYFYSVFGAPYPDEMTHHTSVERFCEVYWKYREMLPWQCKEMRVTAEFLFAYLAGFDVEGEDASLAHFAYLALIMSDRSKSNPGEVLSIRHHIQKGIFGRFFLSSPGNGVYLPDRKKLKESAVEFNQQVAVRPAGEVMREIMQSAAFIEKETAPIMPTQAQS